MNFNLVDIKITSNLTKKRIINKIKNLYRRWKVEISDVELEKIFFKKCNEYFILFDSSANVNYSTNAINSNMSNQTPIDIINPLVEMNSNGMTMFNNLQSNSSDFLNEKTIDEFHSNLINNNSDFFRTKPSDEMMNRCLMVQFPVKSYRFKIKPFNLKDFPLY